MATQEISFQMKINWIVYYAMYPVWVIQTMLGKELYMPKSIVSFKRVG